MSDYDDFDDVHHPRTEPSAFALVVAAALNRRSFLRSGLTISAIAMLASTACRSKPGAGERSESEDHLLGFQPIASSTDDSISLPPGYRWQPLISWGDRLSATVNAYTSPSALSAGDLAQAFGDNNDGMKFFSLGADSALLVVNNEYINPWNYYKDTSNPSPDEIIKAQLGHGVSVINIRRVAGDWQLVLDGSHSRRITARTAMTFTGPAAGHDLLKTSVDHTGRSSLGTWANCGCGKTPWGTYLTCEENFNAYFGSSDADTALDKAQQRYGLGHADWGLGWYKQEARFDLSREPQEANRVGWVVEIDPLDPLSMPRKHTALGRFKHENAEICIALTGQAVVYMGDDERGEFLYRFVSDKHYIEGDKEHNMQLLETGRLYAAVFNAVDGEIHGDGRWLELAIGKNNISAQTGFSDQATVHVFARLAASIAGATTMDRPEWVAAHPHRAELYCALSNNKHRGIQPNAGGDAQPAAGPNPRPQNLYGQILRWQPSEGDHAAETFNWDLFASAGNPRVHEGNPNAGSNNITASNMFNSPDGLSVDARGILWIQTDGSYSNQGDFAGMGNNQMLAADPHSGEIRRFMVGPRGCEITGLCWDEEGETLFVGIQHPGDNNTGSHFPGEHGSVPRSTVIAINKNQGGLMGS